MWDNKAPLWRRVLVYHSFTLPSRAKKKSHTGSFFARRAGFEPATNWLHKPLRFRKVWTISSPSPHSDKFAEHLDIFEDARVRSASPGHIGRGTPVYRTCPRHAQGIVSEPSPICEKHFVKWTVHKRSLAADYPFRLLEWGFPDNSLRFHPDVTVGGCEKSQPTALPLSYRRMLYYYLGLVALLKNTCF